ncbi:DNA/RNA non-specific endonuclease [Staphylococcus aureus]|uniref:DNA/RNA non-specific endonuclease n=1 Tax=Staphylococcus aureus TaxID=1280 RepID=UPI00044DD151|nr:DNA/RNA non-specific endonuclease [Staphylococcus aureus]EZX75042.1 hypothetical protein V110_02632 [Staphylococcus aureus Chi-8]HEO8820575.1 DNA/RNA non-specific endonuclease [Staphylococcus aureus]
MKKIISTIVTIFIVIVGGILYATDSSEVDIHSIFNRVTTGSIENTKEDKALIEESTNNENYKFINDNKTELTSKDKKQLDEKGVDKFWADYSRLDKYGRGGEVSALVTYESVNNNATRNKERPSFASNVHIAGEYKDGHYDSLNQTWRGNESNNQILKLEDYRGYVYNKSHSLAWSLGGDMETHNLTLGTRSQNVGSNKDPNGGGMGYPETQVRNTIYKNHDAKIFYQVTPVYRDKELVPRGSHVRAYSVNDNGKTLNLNVWISNTQKGLDINYKDGTYTIIE